MNDELNSSLGVKLLTSLDSLLKQGKDDSVLILFNSIVDRMLKGGWRGECSFIVDEFKIRKVQFVDNCNLDLARENYKEELDATTD